MIFDLDGFKGYNDSFGHLAGDQLLARLGKKLAGVGGDGVSAYRLGGDEFCMLATVGRGIDAERLIHESTVALTEQGEGFHVTTSFGAVMLPDEASDPTDALRLADERLYAQKHRKHSRRGLPHEVLMQVLLEREPGLHSHMEDVAELALGIAHELGLEGQQLEDLQRAAQLHDIGKLAVPDAILYKPDALTSDERTFIEQHTLVGERILGASPLLRVPARIVRHSHERWDGQGYPDGLAGEAIPLSARIVCVCDAYSAMTSERPYRAASSPEAALEEVERASGAQFDPRVVAALRAVISSRVRS